MSQVRLQQERDIRNEIDGLLVAMGDAESVEAVDDVQQQIDKKIVELRAVISGPPKTTLVSRKE